MTHDEKRLSEIEARVRETFVAGDMGQISKADFEALLASRLAWKFTAKCFATAEQPREEAVEIAAQRIAREDHISSHCIIADWPRLSEGRRETLRRHASAVLTLD